MKDQIKAIFDGVINGSINPEDAIVQLKELRKLHGDEFVKEAMKIGSAVLVPGVKILAPYIFK